MRRRVRETPAVSSLLDTHVWLWYVGSDSSRLAPAVRRRLEDEQERSKLHVSDISFWEVALKSAKGKLSLSTDLVAWLADAARLPRYSHLPVDRDILIASATLRDTPPSDPVDCILIATARNFGMTLVTADRAILAYAARTGALRVLDARV